LIDKGTLMSKPEDVDLFVDPATAPDGWYWLSTPKEPFASVVRLYTNPDNATRGLGFNVSDGAGFLPVIDLKPDSKLRPVN
jgi:hypothetical protein